MDHTKDPNFSIQKWQENISLKIETIIKSN
jgi:hypothetical protein